MIKKLLGIVVLGLLLTFNVSAEKVTGEKKSKDLYVERKITTKERQDFADGKIKFYKCSGSTGTHISKGDCKGSYRKDLIINNDLGLYLLKDYTEIQITNTDPILPRKVVQKEKLKIISGYTTDGNYFEFHMQKQKVKELVKIHGYFDYKQVMDNYYMTEFSKKKVVANDSYTNFANRLGKTYGGERKFYKRYKKEISESEKNCSCEDPIYKTFLLDLETGYAYKVYHPQSNKPKLSGDFRLKKNIGKKALLKTGKIIQDFENAVGMDTIDLLLNGYMIYSAIENPQGVFKKNKGSSSTSSGSTVTKSLGSGSGSGSVLDREFGGQSLKRLIAISRR